MKFLEIDYFYGYLCHESGLNDQHLYFRSQVLAFEAVCGPLDKDSADDFDKESQGKFNTPLETLIEKIDNHRKVCKDCNEIIDSTSRDTKIRFEKLYKLIEKKYQ